MEAKEEPQSMTTVLNPAGQAYIAALSGQLARRPDAPKEHPQP